MYSATLGLTTKQGFYMSLSSIALVLYVFLQSMVYLGWMSPSATFIGVVGLVFVVLRLLEALSVYTYSVPLGRRHSAAPVE